MMWRRNKNEQAPSDERLLCLLHLLPVLLLVASVVCVVLGLSELHLFQHRHQSHWLLQSHHHWYCFLLISGQFASA